MTKDTPGHDREEIMILDHEPQAGYRTALIAAVIAGVLWLAVCFMGVFHHGA